MNKNSVLLLTIFLAVSSLKIIISQFIQVPTMFSDEYVYFKTAHDFFFGNTIASSVYPPLYSILISPAFLAGNGYSAYFFAKVINAFLTTAVIFPSFFIARGFLNSKKSVLVSILVAFIPSHFVSSFSIMSENLFYLLFLVSFYFIYKTIRQKSFAWGVAAGLLAGLTTLTKFSGIILVIVMFFAFLYALVKKEIGNAKLVLIPLVISSLLAALWLFRNFLSGKFEITSTLGSYAMEITHPSFSLASFVTWTVLYTGILVLSLFFILFFYNIKSAGFAIKSQNEYLLLFNVLLILTAIVTIIVAANHAAVSAVKSSTSLPWTITGRAIGRYIYCLLPLFIINGFVGFTNNKTKIESKSILTVLAVITLISSQLVFFQMLPINNSNLSWLGVMALALNKLTSNITIISITFAVILLCMLYFSFKISYKINFSRLFVGILFLFLLTSALAVGVTYYRSEKIWLPLEQTQLGIWLSENSDHSSVLLIDKRDCSTYDLRNADTLCSKNDGSNLIGFWFNGKVMVSDTFENADFIASKHDFNLPVLKETKSGIKIYEAR